MTSIAKSTGFTVSAIFSGFMFGAYTAGYLGQQEAASPTPMPGFDIELYMDPWYQILMSNDLPFFTDSCGQDEVRLERDGTYTFYSRQYDIMTGMRSEMDRQWKCS